VTGDAKVGEDTRSAGVGGQYGLGETNGNGEKLINVYQENNLQLQTHRFNITREDVAPDVPQVGKSSVCDKFKSFSKSRQTSILSSQYRSTKTSKA